MWKWKVIETLIWCILIPLLIVGGIPGFIFTKCVDDTHTDIYIWAISSIAFGIAITTICTLIFTLK